MVKQFPYTYIQGKIKKSNEALIPIQAKVVQYGLGCYTGMRAYWNKKEKQLYIFRLRDHYDRLVNSSNILGMKFPYSYKKFREVLTGLIKKNKVKQNIYIRPVIYAGSTEIKPQFDPKGDDLAIYMLSFDDYLDRSKGIDVGVSKYRRFDDDMIPTKAKATGGYVNAALAKAEALERGYHETIMLNRRGYISEASAANLFIIKKGKILTPPLSDNNLAGITRSSVLELCRNHLGIGVVEKHITKRTVLSADEIFLTGTAARVAAVTSVEGKTLSGGHPGPTTNLISEAFDLAFEGKLPKYKKWLTPIY